ncbi:type IX secretion system sortase PorU [Pontibacter sp. G13]|uniref:type IX secretion system sortase PorU n=1 Tax=Pontibacter sp. G13 TaxID=3074898 RepID=UPI00288B2ACA|nr:type IX secretion system sortase PorU [Pontibacter sp. G13]WNJ15962.1 type IX secretion system sortase PorU [Pontibacter sp. G13]
MIRSLSAMIALCLSIQVQAQSFSNQSVLNDGTWYKIGITETGIYRLDAGFFSQLGIDASAINPQQIQIFGNGGQMLPQLNSADRHDDLVENAIQVTGQGDGSFDNGDIVRFYAEGPGSWTLDGTSFNHHTHLYADTNFYYLRIGTENGLRVTNSNNLTSTYSPPGAVGIAYHESELINPIISGRYWLGETFDASVDQTFSMPVPAADPNGMIRLTMQVAAHSDVNSSFNAYVNGTALSGAMTLGGVNTSSKETTYYTRNERTYELPASILNGANTLDLRLVYNKSGSSRGKGYLDWVEVEFDRRWNTGGASAISYELVEGIGAGQVAEISLGNANGYKVWDVTNPLSPTIVSTISNGNALDFQLEAETPKRIIAFTGTELSPASAEGMANQNLHGMPLVDYLMIVHPNFWDQANQLADMHRTAYNRSVALVTPEQIYQEFSSGKQDVSAIRDFIRMFYERSAGMSPQHVLLFGDGTYVYKDVSANLNTSTNFVPTYQSRNSWHQSTSYTSDDFFGIMEPSEGFWGEGSNVDGDLTTQVNTIDVPIGRLPVNTIDEAQTMVDKIIRYVNSTSDNPIGPWRNRIVLVADYKREDGSTHTSQADAYTSQIYDASACYQVEKIYTDNYPVENTASGEKYPGAREALINSFNEGSLLVNYTGHGSPQEWSNSSIFRVSDIGKLENRGSYPAVVTATCEFGRYDDPEAASGAEQFLLEPDAGAIAMFTTVRLVYSAPNATLNRNFYKYSLSWDHEKNRMPTVGEIMMQTKNITFPGGNLTNINSRNFTLLGDPGLILNYPKNRAQMVTVNEVPIDPTAVDTLKSLQRVKVSGVVTDPGGNPMDDFAGEMEVTVFDKPGLFTTGQSGFSFYWQKNRIFNGLTSVKDGAFEFEFVVPIDISYEPGKGKITTYFFNEDTDGVGCYDNIHVGGTYEDAEPDTTGPTVKLYINDSNWISGGITSSSPDLYAEVFDENGINTIGTGIGHEIAAYLDEQDDQTWILNDYYTAKSDSFQYGEVRYPLSDLELGPHTLTIRVWDVRNNYSEATTEFVVVDDQQAMIEELYNFPNPFRMGEETRFLISHNLDGRDIEVQIDIFTASGERVKQLFAEMDAEGNVLQSMKWDGRGDLGNPLSSGMYIYTVQLKEVETGRTVHRAEKLVLFR